MAKKVVRLTVVTPRTVNCHVDLTSHTPGKVKVSKPMKRWTIAVLALFAALSLLAIVGCGETDDDIRCSGRARLVTAGCVYGPSVIEAMTSIELRRPLFSPASSASERETPHEVK